MKYSLTYFKRAKQLIFMVGIFTATTFGQAPEKNVYLYSSFRGNGQDGLHFAYSKDGLTWENLRNDSSFLAPKVGKSKLMRDPCIIKGGDGNYHMVWTAGWNENGIGYASSKDLVNWSEQKFIPVMAHEPTVLNCWAPEINYDEEGDYYMIYWASTIPGRFPETDTTGDKNYNHRMYYVTTKDFETFSKAEILYDHGFNVIDATIKKAGNEYVMWLKDETRYPPAKNILVSKSNKLTGPYSKPSAPITPDWVEGPSAVQIDGRWIVYYDEYTRKKMGAVASYDLEKWEIISGSVSFPKGTRHGTVLAVPESVVEKMRK